MKSPLLDFNMNIKFMIISFYETFFVIYKYTVKYLFCTTNKKRRLAFKIQHMVLSASVIPNFGHDFQLLI